MSDDLGPWPEKVYLLHPSIKSFGGMVTNPERREYVLADRIEQLERERDEWIAHAKDAIWSDSEELKLAEAKLAKAIEALRFISQMHGYTSRQLSDLARAVLAELEGKDGRNYNDKV